MKNPSSFRFCFLFSFSARSFSFSASKPAQPDPAPQPAHNPKSARLPSPFLPAQPFPSQLSRPKSPPIGPNLSLSRPNPYLFLSLSLSHRQPGPTRPGFSYLLAPAPLPPVPDPTRARPSLTSGLRLPARTSPSPQMCRTAPCHQETPSASLSISSLSTETAATIHRPFNHHKGHSSSSAVSLSPLPTSAP